MQSKAVYDFVFPGILTATTVGVFLALDIPLSTFKDKDAFSNISGLLAILVGFYMAALAAVATFNRSGIDLPLEGEEATLKGVDSNEGLPIVRKLTYRQFVSYLFGYAAFLSFLLYAILLITKSVWSDLEKFSEKFVFWDRIFDIIIEPLMFLAIVFGSWQLFVTSLLGIYFLSERIQSLHER